MKRLNLLYCGEPALYELDFVNDGFAWGDISDWEQSVVSYFRKGKSPDDTLLVVCNFTPVPRHNYRVGVPTSGPLARGPEQRRQGVRRERAGQFRRR